MIDDDLRYLRSRYAEKPQTDVLGAPTQSGRVMELVLALEAARAAAAPLRTIYEHDPKVTAQGWGSNAAAIMRLVDLAEGVS